MTTRAKTGGRKRGSLDKGQRAIITAEYAGDLHTVYKKLGGVKWLLEFAKANPAEFIRSGLSRLWPAPQKDDESGSTYNTQINFNPNDTFECARRVAFALNLGIQAQQDLAPVAERVPEQPTSPQEALNNWRPADVPDDIELTYSDMPEPVADQSKPTRGAFIFDENDARPYDVQFRAWDLCRDTVNNTIETYQGSSPEQGGRGTVQRQSSAKPTAAQLCRRMSRRSELL